MRGGRRGVAAAAALVCMSGLALAVNSGLAQESRGSPPDEAQSKLKSVVTVGGLTLSSEEERAYDYAAQVPSGKYSQSEKDPQAECDLTRRGSITLKLTEDTLKLCGLSPGAGLADLLKLPDCAEALLAGLPSTMRRKPVDRLLADGDVKILEALVLDETGTKLRVRADYTLIIVRLAVGGQVVEIWKRVKKKGEWTEEERRLFPPVEVRRWDTGTMTPGLPGGSGVLPVGAPTPGGPPALAPAPGPKPSTSP